jgi:hypothetical protein
MHSQDNVGVASDAEGFDATDQAAATLLGIKAAGQMIANDFSAGRHSVSFKLRLDDDQGNPLETLSVRASVG